MSDNAAINYRNLRSKHWDEVTRRYNKRPGLGGYYQKELIHYYKLIVPPNMRVLDLGCGNGDFLSELNPKFGLGVDFSDQAIKQAKKTHPQLEFILADVHFLPFDGKFDYIIMSDLVNDLWDVQIVLENLQMLCHKRTRLILNTYSKLWQPILDIAQKCGLAKSNLPQNWFAVEDIKGLFDITGFEIIKKTKEILIPLNLPIITNICNRVIVKLWPLNHLALTNILTARSSEKGNNIDSGNSNPLISIIIPARNESGNIDNIFKSINNFPIDTELIFVEGHSTDQTYQTIEKAILEHADRKIKLFKQPGKGKGDAVRLGFSKAKGDILIILDADLTVPAESLPRFIFPLTSGKAEFINGVRLVYPMNQEAMRFFNTLGNKIFGLTFSWLLGQTLKDTLCGTKALWKEDYDLIAENRSYFGDFDPFGDFDLIFGAAKLNLKIVDLPIRYRERTYGSTNIHRWKHGWLLLKMVIIAAKRIKFV
jgi:ubiquinone/menaquinone biosynthesis C-methylase UbiE